MIGNYIKRQTEKKDDDESDIENKGRKIYDEDYKNTYYCSR